MCTREFIQQIHRSYTGDPTEMLFTWVTPKRTEPSEILISENPSGPFIVFIGTVQTYEFEDYVSGGQHSVLITGLKPSTTYHYQIRHTIQPSDVLSFQTAPPIGSRGFTFAVTGDYGATINSQNTTDGLVLMSDQFELFFIAGDISYGNLYLPGGVVWDKFFRIVQPLLLDSPIQPAVGNHESLDNFTAFRIRFAFQQLSKNSMGSAEFYYSFDYGIVHFLMMDTERNITDQTKEQLNFVENDLRRVNRTKTPWVIAMFHRPWYSSNFFHLKEREPMRRKYEPLFQKYGVDFVFNGHVHDYERTHPVFDYRVTPGATQYLIVGNAGSPEGLDSSFITPQPSWSAKRIASFGFTTVKVTDAHSITITSFLNDFSIFDEFTFTK